MWRPVLIALALAAAGCGGGGEAGDGPPRPQPTSTPAATAVPDAGREPRVETVVRGLEVPWEMAFLPDGRALVTERPGRVRLLSARQLRTTGVTKVKRVAAYDESGLLGLAVDPAFARNRLVYLYRTAQEGNELVRLRLEGMRLREQAVVVDGIETSGIHDGGRMRFDPAGRRLFFTTGDAGFPDLARDRGSRNGKFLTLTLEQARRGRDVAPAIFSVGHRNPQGFDWQPGTGALISDEHGQRGNDEVNLVERGGDYGWPEIEGTERARGMTTPIKAFDGVAPSGGTFVRSRSSPWSGDYVLGGLIGRQLRRLRIRDGRVVLDEVLLQERVGRIRNVVEGPDGTLYAMTSNRDGRGTPARGDDRILRIVPR
jgi:glucose/arabinose dehydrogenase